MQCMGRKSICPNGILSILQPLGMYHVSRDPRDHAAMSMSMMRGYVWFAPFLQILADFESGIEYANVSRVIDVVQVGLERRFKVEWTDGYPVSCDAEAA